MRRAQAQRGRGNAGICRAGAGHPADPARCHVEDGPAVSVSTAQRLNLDYAIYTCFAHAEYQARQHDQAGRPDQYETAPAPEIEPWRPTVTEVDIIAGIQKQCQAYAIN